MTIDYTKLMNETSFKIVKEEEGLVVISLTGGLLNETIVEFKDIDMVFDENEHASFSFTYDVLGENEITLEESEERNNFFTNILFSVMNELMYPEDYKED
ncbi:hypothetical protein [Hyphomonas sp.]|uniref:hypothetical protein n=1 Tax=Hyphomonas sp. TaxID=87 RepID=UPI000C936228|nr:hypothetical protein [Hyphomonas sp.]MAL47112.1 hypothetical protein [Hyphomonas sp.]